MPAIRSANLAIDQACLTGSVAERADTKAALGPILPITREIFALRPEMRARTGSRRI